MAATVSELCNREVFTVRAQTRAAETLDALVRLQIHGAPVVNGDRAVGVITIGDLVGDLGEAYVDDRMSEPGVAVEASTPITLAAETMADHCVHHLVVTQRGRLVGFLSALDIIRGYLGRPPRRPGQLRRTMDDLGLTWTDAADLDEHHLRDVPAKPGIFLLVHGGAFRQERAVWVEDTEDVHGRLSELLRAEDARPEQLAPWFAWGALRFRHATGTPEVCRIALRALGRLLQEGPHPAAKILPLRLYGPEDLEQD
jgi:CBS domain-containing protein